MRNIPAAANGGYQDESDKQINYPNYPFKMPFRIPLGVGFKGVDVPQALFAFGSQEEEYDILDALSCGAFGDERVAAGLVSIAAVDDIFGCVGVDSIGLVVNDDKLALLLEEQIYEAFERPPADGRGDEGFAPVAPRRDRAPHDVAVDRRAGKRRDVSMRLRDTLGSRLRARRVFDACAGGKVYRLQDGVHRPAQRSAATTSPRCAGSTLIIVSVCLILDDARRGP